MIDLKDQSCEGDDCPFSSHMTLAPNLELCRRIYGITPGMVKASVEFTNAFYGSNHPRGSHILFVNGWWVGENLNFV